MQAVSPLGYRRRRPSVNHQQAGWLPRSLVRACLGADAHQKAKTQRRDALKRTVACVRRQPQFALKPAGPKCFPSSPVRSENVLCDHRHGC